MREAGGRGEECWIGRDPECGVCGRWISGRTSGGVDQRGGGGFTYVGRDVGDGIGAGILPVLESFGWPRGSRGSGGLEGRAVRVASRVASFLIELKRRKVYRVAMVYLVVLPFANLSGNPENEPFSEGVTEDIMAR